MNILLLIPARGGSKRVPRKNLQQVGGKSLVERTMDIVRHFWMSNWAILLSDSPEILLTCPLSMNILPLEEPASMAADGAEMIEAVRWVLERVTNPQYDAICLLQPSSPFVQTADVDGALRLFSALGCPSLVSVNPEGKRNGAIYIATRQFIQENPKMYCETSERFYMPAERSIDINTPEDLELARKLAGEQPAQAVN